MASTDSLSGLVDATVERFGGIDIVVNNAGVSMVNSLLAQDDDEFESNWATTLDINLTAHARLVRYAMPHLLESDAARVVNIASTEAIVTTPGLVAYAATKAGVVGLTKSMAVELGRHGITANCICPGPIATAMTSAIPDEAKETYARRRAPLRRYGVPEEVARMTVSQVAGGELPQRGDRAGRRRHVDPPHLTVAGAVQVTSHSSVSSSPSVRAFHRASMSSSCSSSGVGVPAFHAADLVDAARPRRGRRGAGR
ncbi:MAG: SDR family oxidoreductase [Ilumatobacteraceae bacterium]